MVWAGPKKSPAEAGLEGPDEGNEILVAAAQAWRGRSSPLSRPITFNAVAQGNSWLT
jgi:hypothetical protein